VSVVGTKRRWDITRGVKSRPSSERIFLVVAALLFLATAAVTIMWSVSMSDMSISGMGAMPMPGGMSMASMPMCGQNSVRNWLGVTLSFLGQWIVMTVAMMTPSLVPMLWRFRQTIVDGSGTRLNVLTALVAAGYFFAWTLPGIFVFLLGVALTAVVEMELPALARAAPVAGGMVVLIAGAIEFTAWKAERLACCRAAPELALMAKANTALRHGLRLGLHCIVCCANLMAVLLVVGIMDLRAMALITIAITLERLAPKGLYLAQAIGFVIVVAGCVLIAQAAGFV
jgi:predicted metal-binding membrane protein